MTDLILRTLFYAALFFILLMGGYWMGRITVYREAVQEGQAHYDTFTGAFTWGKP